MTAASEAVRTEIDEKLARLAEFLDKHGLDGVLLQERQNFAWATAGGDNHIPNNTPLGVASILATRDGLVCFANEIEAPRMASEEAGPRDIGVVSFPWWDADAARRAQGEVIAGRTVAADTDGYGLGLPPLPGDFAELRWSLTPGELARYRDGGARMSRAVEEACRDIKPGMSEHEVAGLLDGHVHRAGCNPVVTLVAADERAHRYRHPIPTGRPVEEYVMLVTCGEFKGLISCLTRFVSFEPLSEDLRARHQAVCNVETAALFATRPGRTLGHVFGQLQEAYAASGHDGEWRLHHQGGSTGYLGREVIATPDSSAVVRENQAFAWNPSITGVKSEDTVVCTAAGIEVITAASGSWPSVEGHYAAEAIERPGILVR